MYSIVWERSVSTGLDTTKEFMVAVVRGRHSYVAGKASINPTYTVSITNNIASSATSTTVTYTAGVGSLTIGESKVCITLRR